MISLFADKTTIITRKMLREPKREWVIQDFVKSRDSVYGVGQGRVQKILNEMARMGYIEREKRGPKSKAILTNSKKLLEDWVNTYRFEYNEIYSYYSPQKNISNMIKEYFNGKEDKYALTLHAAANLYTSFVKTYDIHLYLKTDNIKKDILDLRQKLDLKQLVQGGNIHIIEPYYKHSVFFNTQKIKGYRVVSNIQLYLDLFHFQPRGREHAEYLKRILEEKGVPLD